MTIVVPDTSVWARRDQAEVSDRLDAAIDANSVALTPPVVIELLTAARSADELRRLAKLYDALHEIPLTGRVVARAREVQLELSKLGHHRGPSVTDLFTAAAAELTGATIWHCDKHYDLIAAVTGQTVKRVGR